MAKSKKSNDLFATESTTSNKELVINLKGCRECKHYSAFFKYAGALAPCHKCHNSSKYKSKKSK